MHPVEQGATAGRRLQQLSRQGSATTPTRGCRPTASDSEKAVQGRPAARFVVPSTGSQYQVGPSVAWPPYSSPTTT